MRNPLSSASLRFLLLSIAVLAITLLAPAPATIYAQTATTKARTPQAAGERTTEHSPARESSPELRRQTFEQVWRTINEKHFDATFGGVDWAQIHAQYEPRIAAVKKDAELYALLQQMLGELHQSHFNIIPPEAIVETEPGQESAAGSIGVTVRLIDNQAVITQLEPNSSAARAGLRAGFVITKVDETSTDEVRARFGKGRELPSLTRLFITRTIMSLIDGAPQTTVRIAYLDHKNQPQQSVVEREKLKGELSPRFGNFPPTYIEFESKRLINNIGYIRFNIFMMPIMERLRETIRAMHDTPGIIIDVRGNPGGFGGMSSGIAGMLTEKELTLGVMKLRNGYLNFIGYPQQGAYLGPVVILVDGESASTSEILAGGLQECGRAVVVGEQTCGAALPSLLEKLPTGALFQYATADFKTPKGVLLEGRGVRPDIEVKMARNLLVDGRDPQLDAAIEQIKKLNQSKQLSATGLTEK